MQKYTLKSREIALNTEYDVIVVGGGPAGCTAAAAAAREGAKTLLVERSGELGGMGTGGRIPFWCGYYDMNAQVIVARGLALRVLENCQAEMDYLRTKLPANRWALDCIDAELLKRVYDDIVVGAGADVLFNSVLASVETDGQSSVGAVLVANKAGLTAYQAKVYVDCTGDADLAAWAGAEFQMGDDKGRLQPTTLCFVLCNIDEDAFRKGPDVHTGDPNSPVHFGTKSDKYPHIIDPFCVHAQIGPGIWGFNTGHIFDVDGLDPMSVSAALVEGRKKAADYLRLFADKHPAFKNAFLADTAGQLGVRETRRIVGDYNLTIEDRRTLRRFPDEICRNAYGIDIHYQKEQIEALLKAPEGFQAASDKYEKEHQCGNVDATPPGESEGVPYRCLCPKGLTNVLVAGRTISTDRPMNGTVRTMACCLNTGEAAGMAAAFAAKAPKVDIHAVDAQRLRARLKEEGAYLP